MVDRMGSVRVRLTRAQAQQVAQSLRTSLTDECEQVLTGVRPGREELTRLRALVDLYMDQLDMIAWGEPAGAVEMVCPRAILETVARDLLEAGEDQVASQAGWYTEQPAAVRRRGREMIGAARAMLTEAVAQDRAQARPVMSSSAAEGAVRVAS